MRQLVLVALLAIVCAAANDTEPEQKSGVGEGHYYEGHGHHYGRYNDNNRRRKSNLVDDYVCDVDASVLIVTQVKPNPKPDYQRPYQHQPGYRAKRSNFPPPPPQYSPQQPPSPPNGQYPQQPPQLGYTPAPVYPPQPNHYYQPEPPAPEPNADRLRCSGIAYTSLEDCQICCKLAARHDQSFSKHDVVGFLIDFNQLDFDGNSPFPTLSQSPAVSPYGGHNVPVPDARCLCCAPKRKVYYRHNHGHRHQYEGY